MARFLIKCSRTIDYVFMVEATDAYDAANNGVSYAMNDGEGGREHLVSAIDNGIDAPWEVTEVNEGDYVGIPNDEDFYWL